MRLKSRKAPFILPLALALLASTGAPSRAYNPIHGRSVALGGAFTATARGVETVGWNPAFLAFSDNPAFSITMPALNLGLRFSNDFLSLEQVNKYFNEGQVWNDSDKAAILAEIEGDEWDMCSDVYLPVFGFSFPAGSVSMALTLEAAMSADIRMSKEFVRLALNGYGIDDFGEQRDFSNTYIRNQGLVRGGLTLAKRFETTPLDWMDEFTIGATISYYNGLIFGDVTSSEANLLINYGVFEGHGFVEAVNAGVRTGDGADVELDYTAGRGYGLDIGIGAKALNERAILGVSLINLFNTITWSDAQRRIYSYDFDQPPGFSGLSQGDKWLEENMSLVDSLAAEESYTSHVPSWVELSAGYWLMKRTIITGMVRQGLNDVVGSKKGLRAGMGLEIGWIPLIPIRAGFSFGSRGGYNYGGGFGVHLGDMEFDLGAAWESGFANSASGIFFGLNATIKFGGPSPDPFTRAVAIKGKEKTSEEKKKKEKKDRSSYLED